MSTWHGVMADGEEFMRWKISTNTVDGYKTDTKCAHSVHGRPTLKDEERFRNGLVRKPYERPLYERTFMSEHFIEKHAISTELCNVNREKHKLKSHRVCRRDREPSRIPIRSLKSLRKQLQDKPSLPKSPCETTSNKTRVSPKHKAQVTANMRSRFV